MTSAEGPTPCVCGHAIEEHGHDPKYPGSTACTECACIAYEADAADAYLDSIGIDDKFFERVHAKAKRKRRPG